MKVERKRVSVKITFVTPLRMRNISLTETSKYDALKMLHVSVSNQSEWRMVV